MTVFSNDSGVLALSVMQTYHIRINEIWMTRITAPPLQKNELTFFFSQGGPQLRGVPPYEILVFLPYSFSFRQNEITLWGK